VFRRHFFLIVAILVIVVMAIAGGFKILTKKPAGGPGGPAAAGAGAAGGGARPGAGGAGAGGGRGAAAVSVAVVRPRLFVDRLEVLGVAKGRQSVTLTSNTAEMVDRVLFRPGDRVRQNQVLIELRRQEEDAGIAAAKSAMDLAKVTADRWNTLAEQGVAPKQTADQYQSAYLSSKAALAAAQSRLNDRVIRAPFAGVVGLSDIAPGALISPGTAIVTLDDMSVIRVDFDVPDRYLSLIHEGGPIQATSDAYPGERYSGKIAKLDTRVDERSRSFKVRAELPNPGGRIKPGMLIRVGIDRGTRMGLAAPEAAIQFSGGQAIVYVITPRAGGAPGAGAPGQAAEKGAQPKAQAGAQPGAAGAGRPGGGSFVAQPRPILTGLNDCGFVEVKDGLQAGDRIVADGLNKIQPNQAIRPMPPGGGRPGGGVPGGAGAGAGAGAAAPGGAAKGAVPQGAAPQGAAAQAGAPKGAEGRGAPGAGGRGAGRSAAAGGACATAGQGGRTGAGMPGGAPTGAPGGRPGMMPAEAGMGGARPGMQRGATAAQ
jgi:membrane fusion protein (multidrug efflux system)